MVFAAFWRFFGTLWPVSRYSWYRWNILTDMTMRSKADTAVEKAAISAILNDSRLKPVATEVHCSCSGSL